MEPHTPWLRQSRWRNPHPKTTLNTQHLKLLSSELYLLSGPEGRFFSPTAALQSTLKVLHLLLLCRFRSVRIGPMDTVTRLSQPPSENKHGLSSGGCGQPSQREGCYRAVLNHYAPCAGRS